MAAHYLWNRVFLISMRESTSLLNIWSRNLLPRDRLRQPTPAIQFMLECLARYITLLGDILEQAASIGFTSDQMRQAVNLLVSRPDIQLCLEPPEPLNDKISGNGPDIIPFNLAARSRSKMAGRPNIDLASTVLGAGLTLGPGHAKAFHMHITSAQLDPKSDTSTPSGQDIATLDSVRDFEARILPRLRKLRILN